MRTPQIILAIGVVVLFVLLAIPGKQISYVTGNEITIEGTVQEVRNFHCPVNGPEGTHLMLATDTGTIQIHVAPKYFLDGKQWSFRPGDRVRVVGSKILFEGHDAVVARTVSRDNLMLACRSESGKPLWEERD